MAPAKKSVVWDFFTKAGEKSTCNMCKIEYKNSNTTTNLVNHLKRKHPMQYNDYYKQHLASFRLVQQTVFITYFKKLLSFV